MSNLMHIVKSQQKQTLNATQKKYFKLIEEIDSLKNEKVAEDFFLKELLEKYNNYLKPVRKDNSLLCKELAVIIDKLSDQFKMSKKTTSQCGQMISYFISIHLEENQSDDALLALKEKWIDHNIYGEMQEEIKNFEKTIFKDAFKSEFDIDVDQEFDFTDPDAFENFYSQHHEKIDEKKRQYQEDGQSKKKTKKQQTRETNEKIEKRTTREIYIKLAKILHPDLAHNEEDRLTKEEAMKLATDAYDKNDVIALLNLEITYCSYNADDLLQLGNDKINHLINSLKSQKNILKIELNQIKFNPLFMPIAGYAREDSKSARLSMFDHDFASLKNNNSTMHSIIKNFQSTYYKNDFKDLIEYIYPMFEDEIHGFDF